MTRKIKLSNRQNRFLIFFKISSLIFPLFLLLQAYINGDFKFTSSFVQILILIFVFGIAIRTKNYLIVDRNGNYFFCKSLNLFNVSIITYNKNELCKSSKIEVSKSIEYDPSEDSYNDTEIYDIYLYDKKNDSIKVSSDTNYNKIIKESEKLAKFFMQDIVDKSLGGKRIRKFSDLNKNYTTKLKERKKTIKIPLLDKKPDTISIEEDNQNKKVTIKPKGMSLFEKGFIIFFSISTLLGSLILYLNDKKSWSIIVFLVFILSLKGLYYILYFNNIKLSLFFSNNEVSFVKGKFYKKTFKIKDIEDIKIITNKTEIELAFISDTKTTILPIDFRKQKDELKYIKTQIDYHFFNIN